MSPSASRAKFDALFVFIAFLIFATLFLFFYPPIYAFRDEGIYLSLAQVLKKGTLFIEKTGIPVSIYIDLKGHHLPFYPPGNPLLLIPFTAFGLQSAFTMGLSLHLLGTFLFKKTARLFGCDHPAVILLYLFFPSFAFYSRTLMSDIPSLAVFLTAYYFYFKPGGSKMLSGFFFGLSLFFRVSNVVVIFPFFAGLLIRGFKEKKWGDLLSFCAALAPLAAGMALYNHCIYGSPFLSGYSEVFTGVKNFSPFFFLNNAIHYFIVLNTAYPLMMLLFLFNRRIARLETYLLLATLFVFFSFYYFQDRYPQTYLGYVFGNRFFYPVIPFLIMAFAEPFQNYLNRFPLFLQKAAVTVLFLFLMAACAGIHLKHNVYLKQQAAARDFLYQNTKNGDAVIYDGTAAELIQAAWGKRHYVPYETSEKMQTAVNNLPPHTDTYLVIRKTSHGTVKVNGALFLALDNIRKFYKIHAAAESPSMTLYKLDSQEDRHVHD